jgi:DNA recombination-mediator protein A
MPVVGVTPRTSLDKAYPAENAKLQQQIYANHLLIASFEVGRRAFRSNLPVRNGLMTALTDATVIIEASDASGVLHQAGECVRLGPRLFITNLVAQDRALTWPKKFLGRPKVDVFFFQRRHHQYNGNGQRLKGIRINARSTTRNSAMVAWLVSYLSLRFCRGSTSTLQHNTASAYGS